MIGSWDEEESINTSGILGKESFRFKECIRQQKIKIKVENKGHNFFQKKKQTFRWHFEMERPNFKAIEVYLRKCSVSLR